MKYPCVYGTIAYGTGCQAPRYTEGVTFIKREESVLVAIALFLLAGVILFNVFTSPSVSDGEAVSRVDVSGNSKTTVQDTTSTTHTTATATVAATVATTQPTPVLININSASLDELMTLTGIGQVKAQAIIDYRETYGPFPTINSLTNVSGIGEKTLAKIADKITV